MDVIDILKDLIRLNTSNPPGNELPAARYIKSVLEPYGYTCTVRDLGSNRGNLIAQKGEGGPELMFNGHLDVVPAVGTWKSDPFQCDFRDNKIYGRGTADMKGGVAAMIMAAIRLSDSPILKHGRLKLLFVADEEAANLGTLTYLKSAKPSDFAVIGEPTGLRVSVAHRGCSREYIDIKGTSRHAALPEVQTDSISRTLLALKAIKVLNEELKSRTHPILPPPSIAVTSIHGYERDNIVPELVRLMVDFRILPSMTHEEVLDLLNQKLSSDPDLAGSYSIAPHFFMPGGQIDPDDPFVKVCLRAREQATASPDLPCAFDASCEQCFLEAAGIKTVILGPGSLKQAHGVDEYSTEDQIRKAVDIYQGIFLLLLSRHIELL